MFEPAIWRFGRLADPFAGLHNLQQDINRLFVNIGSEVDYPAVNVLLGGNDAVITAELPGLDAGKTDISVEGDVIAFRGVREPIALREGESYLFRERTGGEFSRKIRLPFHIDATKVVAKYDQGVLSITVPRAEEDKPRKISITSE
jgi:HSP20 family protein